ncbi:ALG6, ALG8 glycosyltransferase family protein [Toxoplasma gondii CAST]|uniref:dolichyl-P-Glc:Glc1Man9GlcNAc2-PP-dolichol alpha-1,3-glucosyltransferase n=1 Tax=Toxoplasma gondii CAST TaxID=943122 RepID=A0A3R7YQL9_TOXGO|nr:ALG6, ALG8 glycosyltransferase family protein [Toxoplasma gondii CAST]
MKKKRSEVASPAVEDGDAHACLTTKAAGLFPGEIGTPTKHPTFSDKNGACAAWPWIVAAAALIRLLLIPAYRSTDFEVHRNWLAITASQPLSTWYKKESSPSKWTLDYPPLFAFFEFLLSLAARFVDPAMLQVENENYASPACVWFQRLTVILTELVLVLGVIRMCQVAETLQLQRERRARGSRSSEEARRGEDSEDERKYREGDGGGWSSVALLLVLFNAGLLIVDHIHFQYNGFLLGVLLLSIADVQTGRFYRGSVLFTCALLLKHIFLYVAPVYFVFLLSWLRPRELDPGSEETESPSEGRKKEGRRDCRSVSRRPFHRLNQRAGPAVAHSSGLSLWTRRVLRLGFLLVAFVLAVLAPFIATGQMKAISGRLFPFGRGLLHTQWAACLWALYAATDRVLLLAGRLLGWRFSTPLAEAAPATVTSFHVLPNISPLTAGFVTILLYTPLLVSIWKFPSRKLFPVYVALGASVCFATGWHVHEKAILVVSVPLSVAAWTLQDSILLVSSFLVNFLGNLAILPLLPRPHETLLKLTLFLFCTLLEGLCVFLAIDDKKRKRRGRGVCSVQTSPAPSLSPSCPYQQEPQDFLMSSSSSESCYSSSPYCSPSSPRSCGSFPAFLESLEAQCVDALSPGLRPASVRKFLRFYLLFLVLSLSAVCLLYTLQSDFVPNLLLLKLYKAETSRVAAQAAETPAPTAVSALSPAEDVSPLSLSPSAVALGSSAVHGNAALRSVEEVPLSGPTLASLRALSLLLHFHSTTKEEEQKQRRYARSLLAAVVGSPAIFPSSSHGEVKNNAARDAKQQTEQGRQNSQETGEAEESIEEQFWNAETKPALHSILRQWHLDIPFPYRVMFATHALAARFEFLPLLLLVCSSAIGLLHLFVALHVYLLSTLVRF